MCPRFANGASKPSKKNQYDRKVGPIESPSEFWRRPKSSKQARHPVCCVWHVRHVVDRLVFWSPWARVNYPRPPPVVLNLLDSRMLFSLLSLCFCLQLYDCSYSRAAVLCVFTFRNCSVYLVNVAASITLSSIH